MTIAIPVHVHLIIDYRADSASMYHTVEPVDEMWSPPIVLTTMEDMQPLDYQRTASTLLGFVIAPKGTFTKTAISGVDTVWLPNAMTEIELRRAKEYAEAGAFGLKWQPRLRTA